MKMDRQAISSTRLNVAGSAIDILHGILAEDAVDMAVVWNHMTSAESPAV